MSGRKWVFPLFLVVVFWNGIPSLTQHLMHASNSDTLQQAIESQDKPPIIGTSFTPVDATPNSSIERLSMFDKGRTWVFAIVLLALLILGLVYFRNKYQEQLKTREEFWEEKNITLQAVLAKQKQLLEDTRQQLIIQEKHATFGQLLAGIAHEIKNPLNFIINFSDGSLELTEEFEEEFSKHKNLFEEKDYEYYQGLLKEISQNASTIHRNGQRAFRIVRSLMDQARNSDDECRPIDLNSLLEENIKLAYNGYRALKPAFNASIKKEFDSNLPKVKVIAHDLGRVFLNILNNACYAIHKKHEQNPKGYIPTLTIVTEKHDNQVWVRLRDNGLGIPEAIKEKIFQPFYTTKPSGEGNTGLGLAISREIVEEKHNGELSVESQATKFTEFIIKLPLA